MESKICLCQNTNLALKCYSFITTKKCPTQVHCLGIVHVTVMFKSQRLKEVMSTNLMIMDVP